MKAKLKQVNIALDKKDFPKVIEAHSSLEGKCHRVIDECYLDLEMKYIDNRFFLSAYDWLAKIKIAQKDNAAAQAILTERLQKKLNTLDRAVQTQLNH